MHKRVILIIRDGWGYSKNKKGNAVFLANLPNNTLYEKKYPFTTLKAHGNAVGVPNGVQGGSEPGHLTMGAGRIVYQPLEAINKSIKDRTFFKNKVLLKAIRHVKKNKSNLHLMGLFSDQGIHGTTCHLYALMKLARKNNVKNVFIHCFLDGRDVPEKSALKFLREFSRQRKKICAGKIASMVGRYYAMDRDRNYNRTEEAYRLLTEGIGFEETEPITALNNAYKRGDPTDYYVKPIVIKENNRPVAVIKDNDAVIFWNFRSDRTRQITEALTSRNFGHFKAKRLDNLYFVCMSEYDKKFNLPVAFAQLKVRNNLAEVLSKRGLKQLRIAETEKYAHVTFFFNSQIEKPYKGEDRILVPSPKVLSYDLKPEMSAYGITERLLPQIKRNHYGFIAVNFANGDLVGHAGKIGAVVKACRVVDKCIGKIVDEGLKRDYVILVTGDHGNAEAMLYPNGTICPAHGTNDVPFSLISNDKNLQKGRINLAEHRGLSDVAPTILQLMGIKKPKEMSGKSLVIH